VEGVGENGGGRFAWELPLVLLSPLDLDALNRNFLAEGFKEESLARKFD
jgi:hypothetical protein